MKGSESLFDTIAHYEIEMEDYSVVLNNTTSKGNKFSASNRWLNLEIDKETKEAFLFFNLENLYKQSIDSVPYFQDMIRFVRVKSKCKKMSLHAKFKISGKELEDTHCAHQLQLKDIKYDKKGHSNIYHAQLLLEIGEYFKEKDFQFLERYEPAFDGLREIHELLFTKGLIKKKGEGKLDFKTKGFPQFQVGGRLDIKIRNFYKMQFGPREYIIPFLTLIRSVELYSIEKEWSTLVWSNADIEKTLLSNEISDINKLTIAEKNQLSAKIEISPIEDNPSEVSISDPRSQSGFANFPSKNLQQHFMPLAQDYSKKSEDGVTIVHQHFHGPVSMVNGEKIMMNSQNGNKDSFNSASGNTAPVAFGKGAEAKTTFFTPALIASIGVVIIPLAWIVYKIIYKLYINN